MAAREQEGVEDLVRVLDGIGLRAVEAGRGRGQPPFDAVLRIGNRRLPVEVKRDVRDADAQILIDVMPPQSLVVADRFSPRARDLLAEHRIGWLDRRGHLRLVLPPGIFIDRDIDPLIVEGRNGANPFTTVGLDVAIALLLDPTEPPGVREISRRTKTSAGRVSQLLQELRTQGLVNRDGTPAIPDLFEAVVGAWKPRWVALGGTPPPDPTLRLSGLRAAIWHGVPLVVTDDWPAELYVRDEFALRRLVRTYPAAVEQTIQPAARVAICPSPYGFDQAGGDNVDFPVVNHVVVALDLAQDQGRGREALDQWHPEGVIRVW
ncbi:MAG TPA: hypothetical protein VIJ09_02620 [Acidimicrobiales bacterium]|jgi:hypothetical protein